MSNGSSAGRRRAAGAARRWGPILLVVLALAGCGTSRPVQVRDYELVSAQTFPFYRIYWVGPEFGGLPLSAVDGLSGYISSVGDSVYYGNCVRSKGIFGGGSCRLPLQVTTVIYHRHSNQALGAQRNIVIRGVPAVVYDGGRSMELYSGHVAIDVFSDTFEHALRASQQLYPVNAPGSNKGELPPPVYCPGPYGPVGLEETRVLANLPRHVCQKTLKENEFQESIKRSGSTSP
ncbi:MAG TPA: hypothetical protein VLZ06_06930 [Solirubrobacteraceae bacterium]|nr:hypothetical protein [Solirubrobacteraceae bacterium]